MLRNYFKIAWRNMIKDRQFTFLNVMGLSCGIACVLLIYLWVADELSFDKFFDNNDRIYQLMERRSAEGDVQISDESSGLLSEAMKAQMPEIEYASPLAPPGWFQRFTLSVGEKNIKASGQYAGKDYFNIFSFKLLDGKKELVLADKNSIVISDELARKLFNTTENITGKAVHFQHEKDFFVSGVFEKAPYHSSQQFDFVLSFEYLKDVKPWVKEWNNLGPHNFVLLRKGTDVAAFNKKIAGFINKNGGDSSRVAVAMKFSDMYLSGSFNHGVASGGRMAYVRLFSLIAVFILIIGCINFMNLSTAKASRRMKEIGIKKVTGATRGQLIAQFLSESVLMTLFAMALGLVIATLLLPHFNTLTGKQIELKFGIGLIMALVSIAIFTGLLAGSYPALYLSRFNPLTVLKGKLSTSLAEVVSRKGLVVFQFTLSVILIVSVLVIYKQVKYLQSSDPGYNKDNVVKFDGDGKIAGTEETFMAELKKVPGVVNACFTYNNMVGRNYGDYGIEWDGKDPNASVYFEGFMAGYDFVETMGMHVLSGRSFSRNFGADSSKIILNEAAIKVMNIKDPVGKNIRLFDKTLQIVGLVKDFHFESMHEVVKPSYYILLNPGQSVTKMMVRIKGGDQRAALAGIQKLYETYNPGFPFTYSFLSELYQKQYETEVRTAALAKYFSGLAILISCLGLFGLAAFTAQKRQKEIGIRKVVGASVNNIAFMLSKDFLNLVVIAMLIAFPIAWWSVSQWLQGFAYRVNIGTGVFLIAAGFVLLITLLTISFQAIKAALANPVKSLRSE